MVAFEIKLGESVRLTCTMVLDVDTWIIEDDEIYIDGDLVTNDDISYALSLVVYHHFYLEMESILEEKKLEDF